MSRFRKGFGWFLLSSLGYVQALHTSTLHNGLLAQMACANAIMNAQTPPSPVKICFYSLLVFHRLYPLVFWLLVCQVADYHAHFKPLSANKQQSFFTTVGQKKYKENQHRKVIRVQKSIVAWAGLISVYICFQGSSNKKKCFPILSFYFSENPLNYLAELG